MDDLMNRLYSSPGWHQSLAYLSNADDPVGTGVRAAREYTQMQAEQEAQARQAQAREAMKSIDMTGMPPELKELFRVDPGLAIKVWEQQTEMATRQKRQEMMGGLIDRMAGGSPQSAATDIAVMGAATGDPSMLSLATFLQGQEDKSPGSIAEKEMAKQSAIREAEDLATLESLSSKMPSLIDTVNALSVLGEKASYTLPEQGRDWLARQFGESTEGGVARTKYIDMVSNQILPLLRDTFGSQFTAAEGDRLLATMGDPDKTPAEKNASLGAFIRQKMQDVRSLGRQYGRDTSYLDKMEPLLKIGSEGPLSTSKGTPSRAEIEAELKRRRGK